MKLISKTLVAIIVLLSFTSINAQIKNAKTETVKIYGNCDMCEKRIEKAGNLKKIAKVDWNVDSNRATITYDAKKTTSNEILKRIALAGYDSDTFLAPDNVYAKLPGCCQYERVAKVAVKTESKTEDLTENHSNHANHTKMPTRGEAESNGANVEVQAVNQLKAVFDTYFAVKDALIETDGNSASEKAKEMRSAIDAVKMENLKTDEHLVWMNVLKPLKEHSEHIADTKDAKHQRDHFDSLSLHIYELIKVSKPETPTYYLFCPMANEGKGATWLSKENVVKNPYYGSMMLSCGKVTETIK